MVTHLRRLLPALAIVAGIALPMVVSSCDKVPLLAPTGTVINLFAGTNSVSLNSQVQITATAIENGVDVGTGTGAGTGTSRAGAGTPVQNGTVISFTTTIGQIQPSEARTHNGQVTVQFITGTQSGTATITAYSGGASKTLQLKVGTAAASRVAVSASPQSLGSSGGTSTISALVTDDGGSPISGIPVNFSTDAGTLSSGTATTDANGIATTTLTTVSTATVSVTAGGVTAQTVKVNVGPKALSSFTASPQSPTVGQPVTFTVTPSTAIGANFSGGVLNYGDGRSDTIGASGGSFIHAYSATGQYTATAVVNSVAGGTETYTVGLSVGSLQATLSASPNPATVNSPVTFTVSGTSGVQVSRYEWTTDDGQSASTPGPQWNTIFTQRGTKTIQVKIIGLNGQSLGTLSIRVDVQ